MILNNLRITSAALNLSLTLTAPICVFRGRLAEFALDLVREAISGCGVGSEESNRRGDCGLVLHAGVEKDGNVFDASSYLADGRRSESDWLLAAFDGFIQHLPADDDRPVFVYNFFDRIDEATDLAPWLDRLAGLDRQVFVSVCKSYPYEKLNSSFVQTVITDSAEPFETLPVGSGYDDDYTVILCPVCGRKTLDNHWICACCGWEYDGFPEKHYSAANGSTLASYREKFRKAGKKAGPYDDYL